MAKVLIAPATLANREAPFARVLQEAGLELVFPNVGRQMVEEELLKFLPGVDASLAGSEPYTARVLAACPNLKVIARVGVGYDAIDVAAATAHHVAITIAPGTNQEAVAEHTFAVILALAKNVIPQHLGVKAGAWPRAANLPLRGRTLGLVGLGRIGKAVAERAVAFRMPVLATEEMPDRDFCDRLGIKLAPLEQLLAESDFISLHVPLSPQTRHLINRRTLALMKPTAFLVNTARGDIINEADLTEALAAKKLAGAALDVFVEEPPGVCPLTQLDNVVLTAHTAGVDTQSLANMALSAAQAIADLFQGKWPAEKLVNPAVRERWKWR